MRCPFCLPAAHSPTLPAFSSYVTVDDEAGRALFYVFTESSGAPSTDPLVLWLNGGPGCSSLGGGFLSELGPFYPTPHGQNLVKNDFAWNAVANIIFLESPAFVGFSYSNSTDDARVGDRRTAEDSLEFLLRWLERFPQYKGRPLWLAGESYAGHYIPNLAVEIVNHNKEAAGASADGQALNFQGFLVGNAWTDAPTDNAAAVAFWWSHGIISSTARDGIDRHCDFSDVGPLAVS